MGYMEENKRAWEEAFDNRMPGWGDSDHLRLRQERLPFLEPEVAALLEEMDLGGKAIGQFCCNNGRELLSAMQLGAARGVGFDFAENILAQARDIAQKAGIGGCEFIAGNVLDIGPEHHGTLHLALLTIGAITWFGDVEPLFGKIASCLAPGGRLVINDYHPVLGLLPLPGEACFDPENPNRITYSYFQTEPWVESCGMGYLSGYYPSRPFTSFSHTVSDIINGVIGAGLTLRRFDEFDRDIGLTDAYCGRGIPLSYVLVAEKQ